MEEGDCRRERDGGGREREEMKMLLAKTFFGVFWGLEFRPTPKSLRTKPWSTSGALRVKHNIVQECARVKHNIVLERAPVKHNSVQERAQVTRERARGKHKVLRWRGALRGSRWTAIASLRQTSVSLSLSQTQTL